MALLAASSDIYERQKEDHSQHLEIMAFFNLRFTLLQYICTKSFQYKTNT